MKGIPGSNLTKFNGSGGGRRSRHRIPRHGQGMVSLDFARAWAERMQRQRRRQWQRQRRRQRQLDTSVKLLCQISMESIEFMSIPYVPEI